LAAKELYWIFAGCRRKEKKYLSTPLASRDEKYPHSPSAQKIDIYLFLLAPTYLSIC
jgi:hypothetical protein